MYVKRIKILFVVIALCALGAALLPQSAVAGDGWYAEFFNNQTLSGFPTYSWTEPWIGHEWGTGAPSPGPSTRRRSPSSHAPPPLRACAILHRSADGQGSHTAAATGLPLWSTPTETE